MKTHTNNTPEAEAGQHAAFDVDALCEVVRRGVWRIAACTFVGTALACAYIATQPDVFEATAAVQVDEQNPSVLDIPDVNKEDFRLPENLKTVEQQLCTRSLIWRVIQANKFDQTPGFFRPGFLLRMQGKPVSQAGMIDAVLAKITAKLRRGTRLIDITVRDTDPKMAQTLARSLIDEYTSQNAEWRVNPSKEASKILMDEADRLKRKLESAEKALQEYREENRAVSLDDKQNIVVERLKNLNLRVAQAQNEALALESDLAQLDKIGRQPDRLLTIGSIASAQGVLDVQRMLAEKESAFAVLKQRYGPENPAYAQAERQLQQVRASLEATTLNAADALRAKHESAKFAQQLSEKLLSEQEVLALDLNRKATRYDVLSREIESDRALFAAVVKRLKETGVMQNTSQTNIRVVEPPMLPDAPSWRKKLLSVMLGLLGGAALGFGGTVAAYVRRPTIQSSEHATRVLGIPALGAIPHSPGKKRQISHFPAIREPRSPAAEAFRFLLASMPPLPGEDGAGSILFTGAVPGVGTTMCATSCAIAMAQSGVRTLLVDADLRDPQIGRLLSIPAETSGLAECLAGRSALEASVVPTSVENLFVLTAGAAKLESPGLFSAKAVATLLASAVAEYGRVVIDAPPVNRASETLLLARQATATCIVLRSGTTSIAAASRACHSLGQAGRMPLGLILNEVPMRTVL